MVISLGPAVIHGGAPSEYPKLNTQVTVATTLNCPAYLERPRNGIATKEKEAHFHGISDKPRYKDGDSKTFARLSALVRDNLRNWKEGFDTQASKT